MRAGQLCVLEEDLFEYFSENITPMVKKLQCVPDEDDSPKILNDISNDDISLDLFGETLLNCIKGMPTAQVATYIIIYVSRNSYIIAEKTHHDIIADHYILIHKPKLKTCLKLQQ